MSEKVLSVDGLKIGVVDEQDKTKYRFTVDYGSFDLREGEFLLVKGRNGSGKSTFLRFFHLQGTGYFKVLEGKILFHQGGFAEKSIEKYTDEELTRLNREIAYIGQEERFLSGATAYSAIYDACRIAITEDKKTTSAEKRERLDEVKRLIEAYFEKYLKKSFACPSFAVFKRKGISTWSGGQQKMINVLTGFVKAKVMGLKLIIMDEPLNNLDGINKKILNDLTKELRASKTAIIAVTHCQIFEGIGKVLELSEGADGNRTSVFREGVEPSHPECLENFR